MPQSSNSDSNPQGLIIQCKREGRNGRAAVKALLAGEPVMVNTVNLYSAKARERFATALTEKLPGVQKEAIEQQLMEKAAELADDVETKTPQGKLLELSWPEPWPEPVRLADVLDEIAMRLRRHVVMDLEDADAIALWIAWTYCVDRSDIAPILAVTSPAKRCGKTTLGTLIARMTPRTIYASNLSPAALFRSIEESRPTLIIDEGDTFLRNNDELRGLLNCGHTRDAAYVVRVVGDQQEPRCFTTFCAKAILLIGRLPSTIEDRAIVVTLQRKTPDVIVERVTRSVKAEADNLGRKLMRWLEDSDPKMDGDPEIPATLHDRAADNWRPLLCVAEAAGGQWPERARRAALKLADNAEDDDLPIRLLADCWAVFGRDVELSASELISRLCGLPEAPWATLSRGKPISSHKLARILKQFGIQSRHRETGNVYQRPQFEKMWRRYCPQSFSPSADDVTPYGNKDLGAEALKKANLQEASGSFSHAQKAEGLKLPETLGFCKASGINPSAERTYDAAEASEALKGGVERKNFERRGSGDLNHDLGSDVHDDFTDKQRQESLQHPNQCSHDRVKTLTDDGRVAVNCFRCGAFLEWADPGDRRPCPCGSITWREVPDGPGVRCECVHCGCTVGFLSQGIPPLTQQP